MKKLIIILLLFSFKSFSQQKFIIGGGSGGSSIDTSNKWVGAIYRVVGKDSIYFRIGGTTSKIKDSVGTGGGGTTDSSVFSTKARVKLMIDSSASATAYTFDNSNLGDTLMRVNGSTLQWKGLAFSNRLSHAVTDSTITIGINTRVTTITSSSTPTPDADASDLFTVTALAANATFAAPSGSPVNGQQLLIRILDNGTARTLAWNSIYRGSTDLALPSTTTISKTMYLQFIYNSAATKWELTGSTNGF